MGFTKTHWMTYYQFMISGESRKAKEEAAFEAIAAAADAAGMGMIIITSDRMPPEVLYINKLIKRLTGFTLSEIQKESVWAHIPEEHLPKLLEAHEKRLKGDYIPSILETAFTHKNGTQIPVELFASVVEIEGKKRTVAYFRDISYRKQAENALKESEARFRLLVENAPDAIAILKQGKIAYLNPLAKKMLGIGSDIDPIGIAISDYLEPIGNSPNQEIAAGKKNKQCLPEKHAHYRAVDAEGRSRTVEVLSILIEFQGEPALLSFSRDVTERLNIQAKLAHTERLASLGTMAAGVAHEINNPLAYVMINLSRGQKKVEALAENTPGREELLKIIEDTKAGAERVSNIVKDLQRFVKPAPQSREAVDLKSVLENVVKIASHRIKSRAQLITRFLDTPPVYGNSNRLEQLFLNLVINASQAIPEGEIEANRVEISLTPSDDGRVIVEVSDTGKGIDAETLERIFEPFFTTKRAGKGIGLGLAICKNIAEDLGGTIEASSVKNKGSVFRVYLPVYLPKEKTGENNNIPPDNHPTKQL